MKLILTTCGKLNFLSLARHCDSCERRFRQNFKRKFDWCASNAALAIETERLCAIALDHSYIRKSGKKTPGLGYYWPGCAGATKRGVEILGFAQIVAGKDDARFLFAQQTLPLSTHGRTPFYPEHMKDKRDNQTAKCLRAIFEKRDQLQEISKTLVGDSLFASHNFFTGAIALGFNVVSRLRDDAVLQYLYTGEQKGGRGRKKENASRSSKKGRVVNPEEIGKVLPWVHVAIANAKTRLANIYHGIKPEFLQGYLNEFCYKFNRRYFGERLFDRMLVAATSYPPSFKSRVYNSNIATFRR